MLSKMKKYWSQPNHAAYVFLFPSLLVLFAFVIIPLIGTFIISFLDMNIFLNNIKFVGFDNFVRFFQDSRALNAFKNTLYFALLETPMQIIFGLVMAVLVSKNSKFKKFCRSIYFIPVVCSMTSIGIIFSMLLDPNIGAVPYFFKQLGMATPQFFRDPTMAMPTVALMTVWKNFGVTMTILLTGIHGISESLYEAASIDGATEAQKFFQITIPQLAPSLGFCLLTNLIGSLQVFDQVYVTTNGGPQFRTETAVQYIYSRGFSAPYELGYASAISFVLFVVIAGLAVAVNIFNNRQERNMR